MSFISRLQAAYAAFRGEEEPINGGHRYAIVIGECAYMADAYWIDPYSGLPEWTYQGADGKIWCKRYEGWILKVFGEGGDE